jgi:hypothetical protein
MAYPKLPHSGILSRALHKIMVWRGIEKLAEILIFNGTG